MGKNVHVVPDGDDWGVKGEGSGRFDSKHPTQRDAIERGRDMARNQRSELFIHGRDGKIRDRDSYGNDPHPPKDTRH